jgi:hypothetical protein
MQRVSVCSACCHLRWGCGWSPRPRAFFRADIDHDPERADDMPPKDSGPSSGALDAESRVPARPPVQPSTTDTGRVAAEPEGRNCCDCGQPLPVRQGRGRPRLRCLDCAAVRHRETKAAWKRRGAKSPSLLTFRREIEPGDPGTPEWCAFHGFGTAELERHGIERRSNSDEEEIVPLYANVKPNKRGKKPDKPTIRRVVRESGGLLVMAKFPLPGYGPIPYQLDPDNPVVTNPASRWMKHDRILPEGRKVLALIEDPHGRIKRRKRVRGQDVEIRCSLVPMDRVKKREARQGKRIPVYGVEISEELAQDHIKRARDEPYDRATGEGDHRGENVKGWHRHAPRAAKYVNFGENQRIDVGPDGLESWRSAPWALLVLEGKKKHLAAEAQGWPTASVLSITMWTREEIRWLGRWILDNNPDLALFIVPDGDWAQFERNRGAVLRQTMYVVHELREIGVHVAMLTTPVPEGTKECGCDLKELLREGRSFERVAGDGTCNYCGGYLKAIDDWYGAGGTADDLIVFKHLTPFAAIAAHVLGLPIHGNAKAGRVRALRALSLHDQQHGDFYSLDVPLKTLQKIMGARKPHDIPRILEDLTGALEIEGSIAIDNMKKRPYIREDDHSIGEAWDWKMRPTIRVRPEYKTLRQRHRFADWKECENDVTTAQYQEVRRHLSEQDKALAKILRSVNAIELKVTTGDDSALIDHIVDELIDSARVDDAPGA